MATLCPSCSPVGACVDACQATLFKGEDTNEAVGPKVIDPLVDRHRFDRRRATAESESFALRPAISKRGIAAFRKYVVLGITRANDPIFAVKRRGVLCGEQTRQTDDPRSCSKDQMGQVTTSLLG